MVSGQADRGRKAIHVEQRKAEPFMALEEGVQKGRSGGKRSGEEHWANTCGQMCPASQWSKSSEHPS